MCPYRSIIQTKKQKSLAENSLHKMTPSQISESSWQLFNLSSLFQSQKCCHLQEETWESATASSSGDPYIQTLNFPVFKLSCEVSCYFSIYLNISNLFLYTFLPYQFFSKQTLISCSEIIIRREFTIVNQIKTTSIRTGIFRY